MNFQSLGIYLVWTVIAVSAIVLVLGFLLPIIMDFSIFDKIVEMPARIREARKPHLYKCRLRSRWGIIPMAVLDRELAARDQKRSRNQPVSSIPVVDGVILFSSSEDVPSYNLTGTEEVMNELLKGCVVKYCTFTLPTSGCVSIDRAKGIIESARPKLVRNFVQRHWKNATLAVLAVALVVSLVFLIKTSRYNATASYGVGRYNVLYETRHGRLPIGETVKELQDDPAVVVIDWSEDSTDKYCRHKFRWVRGQGWVFNGDTVCFVP